MKPIIFNTEMVRAILEGRKFVTRRLVKGADKKTMYAGECALGAGLFDNETNMRVIEPPFKRGDILYVRETWRELIRPIGEPKDYAYKADVHNAMMSVFNGLWKPSIHMPKEAARLFLKVTYVGVEKLQDMELGDFVAEGITLSREDLRDKNTALYKARELFRDLWNSTLRRDTPECYAHNYSANPYVWVIEFDVISKEEALTGSSPEK